MWAAIKVAWLEGETTEQKICLLKNMEWGLPSLPAWEQDKSLRSTASLFDMQIRYLETGDILK